MGTNEYIKFCKLIGAENVICNNAGTGSLDNARYLHNVLPGGFLNSSYQEVASLELEIDRFTKTALESKEGVKVYNFGVEDTHTALHTDGYSARYDATKGFFPIPQSQIDLSEGMLEQNERYSQLVEGLFRVCQN